jgi:hypothetical protein
MPRHLTAIALALTLAACATQAQQQAQNIVTSTTNAANNSNTCVREVFTSADFEPLRADLPFDPTQATLQQLTNGRKATQQQIDAIFVVHPRYQVCRKTALEQFAFATPTIVPVMTNTFAEGDNHLIKLVQKKSTWGEYVQSMKETAVRGEAQMTVEFQRIAAGLEQSHAAELQRRQNAANALAAYAQRQQMIDAMNRPVQVNVQTQPSTTNCRKVGNAVNCTTW